MRIPLGQDSERARVRLDTSDFDGAHPEFLAEGGLLRAIRFGRLWLSEEQRKDSVLRAVIANSAAVLESGGERGVVRPDHLEAAYAAAEYLKDRAGEPVLLARVLERREDDGSGFVRIDGYCGVLADGENPFGIDEQARVVNRDGGIVTIGGHAAVEFAVSLPDQDEGSHIQELRVLPLERPLIPIVNQFVLGEAEHLTDGRTSHQILLAGSDIVSGIVELLGHTDEAYVLYKLLVRALQEQTKGINPALQHLLGDEYFLHRASEELGALERTRSTLEKYLRTRSELETALAELERTTNEKLAAIHGGPALSGQPNYALHGRTLVTAPMNPYERDTRERVLSIINATDTILTPILVAKRNADVRS